MAAAVWGPPEANPWLSHAIGTIRESLDLPQLAPGAPGPFALADPGVLQGALADAGLERVQFKPVAVRCGWLSPGAYAAFHQASPMRRLAADAEPAKATRAWAEVAAAAARRWGWGPLQLDGQVLVISARGPQTSGQRLGRWRRVGAPQPAARSKPEFHQTAVPDRAGV